MIWFTKKAKSDANCNIILYWIHEIPLYRLTFLTFYQLSFLQTELFRRFDLSCPCDHQL